MLRSLALRRALVYLWQGPASLPTPLRLEWRFVAIRWLGILFVLPALPLTGLSPARLAAAYAVLALAIVYNLTLQMLLPRRPSLFVSGYITVFGDSLLNLAMVHIGGGFDTPFYYSIFTVALSAAMRYGYRPSLITVLLFVCLDALETRPGTTGQDGSFLFRSSFLLLTTILAVFLREQASRAEAALQERLRQASLLNEATGLLSASLEFERVLGAVAAAACHLYGGVYAVLLPAAELRTIAGGAAPVVHPPDPAPPTNELRQLTQLCERYAGRQQPIQCDRLPTGQQAVVLALTLPTRQAPLATLALSLPPDHAIPALDPDLLESFVERTTLAIENASLYHTLAGRSDDLQRAYRDLAIAHQELLGVDEMKTNFLANVSHELRTPLSSIRSFSELLLTYDDPVVQQEFLQIINSESERLTRLVNDVLDISKIEAGKMDWHLTEVDLAALLRDSVRPYRALMAEQGLDFEETVPDDLPMVYADRDRLQQVIGNLLGNAAKFTPQGTIWLRATRAGDEIHVAIRDTGVGIAPRDHHRIFEKFHQVGDTLTDKPKGTGLGLCICRDIIAYHQGRLWVESELGQGSTFTFTLPVPAAIPSLSELTEPPVREPLPIGA